MENLSAILFLIEKGNPGHWEKRILRKKKLTKDMLMPEKEIMVGDLSLSISLSLSIYIYIYIYVAGIIEERSISKTIKYINR